jgi:hypothetical protein
MAAKIDDLLNAAEYILSEGNPNVILCERGIKTFETATRNTLDLNANAVRSVKLIGDALSDAVEEARALLRELTADELEQSALFVASAITGLSSALRSIIHGFTDGINDLAAVFNRILGEIRSVAGAGLVGPDDLATATRLATVFFGLRTTIKAIGPAIGLVTTRVAGLNAGLATTNGLVNSVLLRIGSLAAVLLALPVAAATVSDSIAGLDDDLSASANITLFVKSLRDGLDNLLTDVELFTRGFRLQFEILVIQAGGLWERFWDGFKLLGYQAILGIVVTLRDTLRDTAESLSSLGGRAFPQTRGVAFLRSLKNFRSLFVEGHLFLHGIIDKTCSR